MAAITDLSDLINRMTGGNDGTPETIFWYKVNRVSGVAATTPIAGRGASLWQYDGMPAGGSVPTGAEIPTRTTLGAIPFTAPGGLREKWLLSAGVVPTSGGTFLLYDRLFHTGGLSSAVTSAQTVQGFPATPALTRNTGGEGNIAFYEIYTQLGATSATLTMTYTNQAGTQNRTSTINIGNTNFREVTRMQRIPLAAGDTGIQSIQNVQLSASTTTAGNFGITIARPIAWISVSTAGVMGWRDYTTGLPGFPAIASDACLALMYLPITASAPEVYGGLSFVEK